MKYEWCPVCESKTRDLAHHVGYWHTQVLVTLVVCFCGKVFTCLEVRDHWAKAGGLDVHIMEAALK